MHLRSMILRVAFTASVGIAALGGTAAAQALLQSWSDPNALLYGYRIATLGDVDGDGRADVAIGALDANFHFVVEVRSSHDGSLLQTIDRGYSNLLSIGSAGDVDADGSDDVVIGALSVTEVVSSATGALLAQVPAKTGVYFGYRVAGVGDVDGDGTPDFAASGLEFGISGFGSGYLDVCSGLDGHVLYELTGDSGASGGAFGSSLAVVPDFDGDGMQDLLVGDPLGRAKYTGYVRVVSLATGGTITTVDAPASYFGFGSQIAVCRDFTGDGVADWVVCGGSFASTMPVQDQAFLVSGADQSIVLRLQVPGTRNAWTSVSGAGDVNGDGAGDFLLGSTVALGAMSPGSTWLYDGRTKLPLYTFELQESGSTGPFVAGVPDVNGDGLDDVLLGPKYFGVVELRSGNDLFLDASPVICLAGETFTKSMRTGVPGNLGLIALIGVDGIPFFLPILGPTTFDPTGSMGYSVPVPAGLAGHSLDYLGFAIDANHHVIASAVESITLK